MSLDSLSQRLVATARAHPPSEEVPYAFGKRVMARLLAGGARALDPWLQLTRGLWRAVVPCCTTAALIIAWSWQMDPSRFETSGAAEDDLEVAVVDSIDLNDSVEDSW